MIFFSNFSLTTLCGNNGTICVCYLQRTGNFCSYCTSVHNIGLKQSLNLRIISLSSPGIAYLDKSVPSGSRMYNPDNVQTLERTTYVHFDTFDQLFTNNDNTQYPCSLCPVVALHTISGSWVALIVTSSFFSFFVCNICGFVSCTLNVCCFCLT